MCKFRTYCCRRKNIPIFPCSELQLPHALPSGTVARNAIREVVRLSDCIFCHPPGERVFLRNEHAYALWDAFPVSAQHSLIIPHRHLENYFELSREEVIACDDLLHGVREILTSRDPQIQGFNLGVNVGSAAGQTVFHCHIHLIPRRPGDVSNPRGGIRNVIPGKGSY